MNMFFPSKDNNGRRSGIDRRDLSYTFHVPEKRSRKARRSGMDRRETRLNYRQLKQIKGKNPEGTA